MLHHSRINDAISEAEEFARKRFARFDGNVPNLEQIVLKTLEDAKSALLDANESRAYGLLCFASGLVYSPEGLNTETAWWLKPEEMSKTGDKVPDGSVWFPSR